MSKLTISIILIYQFFLFSNEGKKRFIEKVLFFSLYFFSIPNKRKKMSFFQLLFFLFFFLLTFFQLYFLRFKQSLKEKERKEKPISKEVNWSITFCWKKYLCVTSWVMEAQEKSPLCMKYIKEQTSEILLVGVYLK